MVVPVDKIVAGGSHFWTPKRQGEKRGNKTKILKNPPRYQPIEGNSSKEVVGLEGCTFFGHF